MLKYFSPILLCLIAFYFIPYLVFKVVQFEKHERKSKKEESYIRKNLTFMIINCVILPLICFSYFGYKNAVENGNKKQFYVPKQAKKIISVVETSNSYLTGISLIEGGYSF